MKHNMKIIKTIASVAVLAFASNSAWAAGTAAGTPVNNTASISYSVSGTSQTPIASSPTGNSVAGTVGTPTSFLVDKKIDLLVTAGSSVNVAPGTTSQSITYTVKNEGNSAEDFTLSASQVASLLIILTPQHVQLQHLLLFQFNLAAEATLAVTVQCNIPPSSGTVVNGASSHLDLLASVVGGDSNNRRGYCRHS